MLVENIDAVITWVDGSDPVHAAARQAALPKSSAAPEGAKQARFIEFDEVSGCIRSILKYASYFRKIYVVTDKQTPPILASLKQDHPRLFEKIILVDHRVIYRDFEELLPVFNSLSIETFLFRIPDLSEHFVYFNDDTILCNQTSPEDFFQNGKPVLHGMWFGWGYLTFTAFTDLIRKSKGKPKRFKTLGFKSAQFFGARMAGYENRAFCVTHSPRPLRKSVFETAFKTFPEEFYQNAAHKFRSPDQFTPWALTNHNEIAKSNAILRSKKGTMYITAASSKAPRIFKKIKQIEDSKEIKFLCIQDLFLAPKTIRGFLSDWIEKNTQI